MATAPAARAFGSGKWLVVLLVIALAGGGYAWWATRPAAVDQTDMPGAFQANLSGIGYLDMFHYAKAVEAFEEAHRKAPKWIPGRINLGIALLNWRGINQKHEVEVLERAVQLFRGVIKDDSDSPHAHFCLGIILKYQKDKDEEARAHFRKVTELDPEDADAWVEYGNLLEPKTDERFACMKKAFELSPYNNAAVYGYRGELQLRDPAKARELVEDFEKLRERTWYTLNKLAYSAMGRNAMPVGLLGKHAIPIGADKNGNGKAAPLPLFGQPERFKVTLAEGARWAKAEDFGPEGDLHRAVRKRFGAAIVALDYDGDGKIDLFLAGAVVEKGRVRDLLLHNEGNGELRDVTRAMGLADHSASLGAAAADYDNDGYSDLLLAGLDHPRLFQSVAFPEAKRKLVDVTMAASLDKARGVFLAASFADLDQDGDLDLLLVRLAGTAADALATLAKPSAKKENAPVVCLNIGAAKPQPSGDIQGLATAFKLIEGTEALTEKISGMTGVLLSDIDHDRDMDIVVTADANPFATVVLNDRLLKFRRTQLPAKVLPAGVWNGGLILDSRQIELNDLFMVGPGQRPLLLLNNSKARLPFGEGFEMGVHNSPILLQARAADLDLDGRTDIVGLSGDRKPVFIRNDGKRLVLEPNSLDLDDRFPADGLAVNVVDLDGDHKPDVLFWSESQGLRWLRNLGNDNNALQIVLSGRRFKNEQLRTNNDAVGAKIRIHAGSLVTGGEVSTQFAGPGQSHQPLLFGIGRHKIADVVRIRWPDNVWQGEMAVPAWSLVKIAQTNRMPASCPLLFTWDGAQYTFICDFLGGGAIGEALPDRSHRPPRSEESVKIESRQLQAKDGQYVLKLAEPMDEVTYLDKLQLVVVDHPAGVRVYPEERFASKAPSQDLHAFKAAEEIHPVSARDHKGRDVTKTLRHVDRDMVDGFARRSWLGYAEDHYVDIDFADQLAKFGPQDRLFLCLAGWTDYPYPEAMWAANQAGVALQAPVLERQKADGAWEVIVPEVGFPAGRPRLMMTEITGKVHGPKCVVRLKTNMQVYWDQLFIAQVKETATSQTMVAKAHQGALFNTTTLPVAKADLTPGHIMQEYSPDGKQPTLYNFHHHEAAPVTRQSGKLTRFGDVTELLNAADDRFVIFGASDELTVRFDAAKLPSLPAGWTRSFVLRTAGYCKSASPFTATGDTIEPLPFRAMSGFPYPATQRYPQTPLHLEYLRKYQTRPVGSE